jgi:hypothetical protein
MRARDVRALAFCGTTTLALLAGAILLTHNYVAALALTVAYAALLLTRPRMIRVFRRMRGEPDWGGYFDNQGHDPRFRGPGGDPVSGRAPAGSASRSRPDERR